MSIAASLGKSALHNAQSMLGMPAKALMFAPVNY